jgi:FeS assembly SUF system regulator
MIRMTRLTDYAIVLLTTFAREPGRTRSASELAKTTRVPLPTVSKVLKLLAQSGILAAHRGVKGGFSLTRRPEEISVTQIIGALERSIAMTQCCETSGDCRLEPVCMVRDNWRRLNRVVLKALDGITLAEMTRTA